MRKAPIRRIAGWFSFAFGLTLVVAATGTISNRAIEYRAELQRQEHVRMAKAIWREKEMRCLAENGYHEARSEKSREAVITVMMVTMARARDFDRQWPNTVCGVVEQELQFSWTLDHRLATKRNEQKRWSEMLTLARDVYAGFGTKYVFPNGGGCVRFYKRTDDAGVSAASKRFFGKLVPVIEVGSHTFFQEAKGCVTPMPMVVASR